MPNIGTMIVEGIFTVIIFLIFIGFVAMCLGIVAFLVKKVYDWLDSKIGDIFHD
jgi:type IV secretory pathway VirB3-like protein